MLKSTEKGQLNNTVLSTKYMTDETQCSYISIQLSPQQVEELTNNLTSPELYKESANRLIYYFSKYPYIYDNTYIKVLFEFFKEENQQPDEVISSISQILISLFEYNEQSISVLEVMKNENFYSLIWPYIDRVPSVMVLYKWLIKTFDCVFDFAIRNDICTKLSFIVFPENENTITLFGLISSFARYTKYYKKFEHLINAVCTMTFGTINLDTFISGITCIGEFTKKSKDFAIQICMSDEFFQFCSNLDQGRIYIFKAIVEFLEKTLQNRQIYFESGNSKCGISSLLFLISQANHTASQRFEQCIYSIINAAVKVVEQVQSKSIDDSFFVPAVKAFSLLIYGPEIVKFYISANIHTFLFDMAKNGDITYNNNVEIFRAICNLVSTSYFNEAKVLIQMGFINLLEEQIEMMIKLPNTTIDALDRIADFGETYTEAKHWGNLIFDNDTIISQLQYMTNHPDEIDEDNYARDFAQSISSLFNRQYQM